MSEINLLARLEALLFVAPDPVHPTQLANALDIPVKDVEQALLDLEASYTNHNKERGIRLQRYRGRVQLTSIPEAAEDIERFLGLEATTRLSRAALETLAIIVYQEPVTRPQIDAVRGVNSDGVLRSLLSKGLIEEVGRAGAPGRPILYSTTVEFLQHFGLNTRDDLPPLSGVDDAEMINYSEETPSEG